MQNLADTMRFGQMILAAILIMQVAWLTYKAFIDAKGWRSRDTIKALIGLSALCFLVGQIVGTLGLWGGTISPRMFFLMVGSILAIPVLFWFMKNPDAKESEVLEKLIKRCGDVKLSEAMDCLINENE